jgi:hypothetical protein
VSRCKDRLPRNRATAATLAYKTHAAHSANTARKARRSRGLRTIESRASEGLRSSRWQTLASIAADRGLHSAGRVCPDVRRHAGRRSRTCARGRDEASLSGMEQVARDKCRSHLNSSQLWIATYKRVPMRTPVATGTQLTIIVSIRRGLAPTLPYHSRLLMQRR